jgi:chaperonin cofactor prefoldin
MSEEEITRLQSALMSKDDIIAQLEHRLFTIQEDNASVLAELNERIRGYEENIASIAKQQETKDQEFEDMY